MPVNIGDKPQADFSRPLELMKDCHRRIEKFLAVLQAIARAGPGPLDQQHQDALLTALDYFRQAAPRHNQDEEISLLGALKSSDNAQARQAVNRMNLLVPEHRLTEGLHGRLDEIGRRWLADSHLPAADHKEFSLLVAELNALYPPHIAAEEAELFPAAARILSANALETIGEQMRQRRVANPGRQASRCAARRRENLK